MQRLAVADEHRVDAGDCLQGNHGHSGRRLSVDDDQHGVVDHGDIGSERYRQRLGFHEHRGEQYER